MPQRPAYISEIKIEQIRDAFSGSIGAISAISLVLAIFNQAAYFYTMQLNFLGFLSAADYLKSTVRWLPLTIFIVLINTTLSSKFARKSHQKTIDQIRSTGSAGPQKRTKTTFILFLFLWLYVIFVAPAYGTFEFLLVLAAAVWLTIMFAVSILSYRGTLPFFESTKTVSMVYIVMPALVIFSIATGTAQGLSDIERSEPVYTVKNSESTSKVILLSGIDRGLLVKDVESKRAEFIPWDDVKYIRKEDLVAPPGLSIIKSVFEFRAAIKEFAGSAWADLFKK